MPSRAGPIWPGSTRPTAASYWLKSIFTPGDSGTPVITADGNGVYLTGHFTGSVDFDPSPSGVYNMSALGSSEIFVEKLAAADGSFVWAKQMGGSAWHSNFDEYATDIAVGGGVVLTGGAFISRDADFDPGSGSAILIGDEERDGFVSRLTTDGSFVGVNQVGAQLRSLDDGDIGYTESGRNWKNGSGLGGDSRTHMKGDGSNVARWTFSGLTPGQLYEVRVTWKAGSKNATNAVYKINGVAARR